MTHEKLTELVLELFVAFGADQAYLGDETMNRVAMALHGIPKTAAIDFVGALAAAQERLAPVSGTPDIVA